MWINDQYSYAYNNGVRSAVVSATVGTTTAYVVLANQYPQTWYNIVSGCLNNNSGSHCWLADSIISQLTDNMPYTVKLCSENATSLANNPTACTARQTYTGSIGKKPLLKSQLSDALFPSLTTPSSLSLSGMGWNDGFVQVNWTNATQGPPVYFVQLGWWDGMNEKRSEQDVTSTTTSVNIDTLGTTTPPQWAWIWISSGGIAGDVQYSAEWKFNQQ